METVAIIQARMTSTRLPEKVLAEVAGQPILEHVVRRARRTREINRVVVATSDRPKDDPVEQFCRATATDCFRGSELDVLDRYYRAAQFFSAEVIVRLTADCPLLDPGVIDRVIAVFRAGGYDYVSNTLEPTYPDGLDTEVFGRETLERAWREAQLKSEREHVTPYIWKRPAIFRLTNVRNEPPISGMRWTVDEPEDLEFVRQVYMHLGPEPSFGMRDVLLLLDREPKLGLINARIGRNEGYSKSLREDGVVTETDHTMKP